MHLISPLASAFKLVGEAPFQDVFREWMARYWGEEFPAVRAMAAEDGPYALKLRGCLQPVQQVHLRFAMPPYAGQNEHVTLHANLAAPPRLFKDGDELAYFVPYTLRPHDRLATIELYGMPGAVERPKSSALPLPKPLLEWGIALAEEANFAVAIQKLLNKAATEIGPRCSPGMVLAKIHPDWGQLSKTAATSRPVEGKKLGAADCAKIRRFVSRCMAVEKMELPYGFSIS